MENMKNAQDVIRMPSTKAGCQILNGLSKSEVIETLMEKLIGNRLVTSDGNIVGTLNDFSFSIDYGELIHLYLILQNTGECIELPVTLVENIEDDTIIVSDNYLDYSIKIYFMKREQTSYVKGKKLLKALGKDYSERRATYGRNEQTERGTYHQAKEYATTDS